MAIPSSIEKFGEGLFVNCNKLDEITILEKGNAKFINFRDDSHLQLCIKYWSGIKSGSTFLKIFKILILKINFFSSYIKDVYKQNTPIY